MPVSAHFFQFSSIRNMVGHLQPARLSSQETWRPTSSPRLEKCSNSARGQRRVDAQQLMVNGLEAGETEFTLDIVAIKFGGPKQWLGTLRMMPYHR
jgi:hypothetical protein